MGLEDKLQDLQKRESARAKLWEEAHASEKRLLEEAEKQAAQETKVLETIAKEKLYPLLEVVNKIHLNGGGKITLESHNAGFHSRVDSEFRDGNPYPKKPSVERYSNPKVTLVLIWGAYDEDHRGSRSWGHSEIFIQLAHERIVGIGGARTNGIPTFKIDIDEENAVKKIEEAIYSILTSSASHSSHTKNDVSRD